MNPNQLMTYPSSLSPDLVIPRYGELRIVYDWEHWRKRRTLLLRIHDKLPHYLLLPEVHQVLNAIKDLETHFLVNTLWHTGARVSEALAITRDDFHFLDDPRTACVVLPTLKKPRRGRPSKQDKESEKSPRLAPLINADYIEELHRYLATTKPNKGESIFTITRQTLDNRLKEIQKQLELPVKSLSAHTFRHSFAVNLLYQGRSAKVVQELLGHTNYASTEIYLRILEGETNHLLYGVQF